MHLSVIHLSPITISWTLVVTILGVATVRGPPEWEGRPLGCPCRA